MSSFKSIFFYLPPGTWLGFKVVQAEEHCIPRFSRFITQIHGKNRTSRLTKAAATIFPLTMAGSPDARCQVSTTLPVSKSRPAQIWLLTAWAFASWVGRSGGIAAGIILTADGKSLRRATAARSSWSQPGRVLASSRREGIPFRQHHPGYKLFLLRARRTTMMASLRARSNFSNGCRTTPEDKVQVRAEVTPALVKDSNVLRRLDVPSNWRLSRNPSPGSRSNLWRWVKGPGGF